MTEKINYAALVHTQPCNSGIYDDNTEFTPEYAQKVIANKNIDYVQISKNIPKEAFLQIDNILMQRPDITLRIFGLYDGNFFDLNILKEMPHLRRLQIDDIPTAERINCDVLGELTELRYLKLCVFDLKDYSFIKELPEDLEELHISADSMKGSVNFDCKWLLKFKKLHSLSLEKKAKKNISKIGKLKSLKTLSLRGIKLSDFNFLHDLELEEFFLLWCTINDLSSLAGLTTLKKLHLWRIAKLEDISFISSLSNLEKLQLSNLKLVKALPDLSGAENLEEIILENVPIDKDSIPMELQGVVKQYK